MREASFRSCAFGVVPRRLRTGEETMAQAPPAQARERKEDAMKDKTPTASKSSAPTQAKPSGDGQTKLPGQVGKAPHAPGESDAADASEQGLRLPHERDQSLDATSDAPDPVMRQAHDDIASGQVDTDMRQTPGLDAEQRKKMVRKQP